MIDRWSVETERHGSCVVCQRRDARFPMVCDADRSKLASWLRDIAELVVDLHEPIAVEWDNRLGQRAAGVACRVDGRSRYVVHEPGPADPVAHHLRAAPVPGQSNGGRVSGSKERPLPMPVTPLDLKAPERVPNTTRLYPQQQDDQVGELSVATVLDGWARDWRNERRKGENLPHPVVADLAVWLGNRLDWACDDHPAVDEFAADISHLRALLRAILGHREVPDYKKGVPCRRCDSLTLFRLNGSDWVECGNCPDLMSPDEYERWCGLLAATSRRTA